MDLAAAGVDAVAAALGRHRQRGAMADYAGVCAGGKLEQALVISRRIERAMSVDDDAAVIKIAVDFRGLFVFFDYREFPLETGRLPLRRLDQAPELTRAVRREEPAAAPVGAVDPAAGDELAEPVERAAGFADERMRGFTAVGQA